MSFAHPTVELRANTTYRLRWYLETQDLHAHVRVGNDQTHVHDSVIANLQRPAPDGLGTVGRLVVDYNYNHITNDVLSAVMTFTPRADVQTETLDAQLLASARFYALNTDAPQLGYYDPTFGRPEIVDVDHVDVLTADAAAHDTSTPHASGSILGRATSQLNPVDSTDPVRDHSITHIVPNVQQALPDVGIFQSPWLVGSALAVGALALLVGVGYAAHSLAELKH